MIQNRRVDDKSPIYDLFTLSIALWRDCLIDPINERLHSAIQTMLIRDRTEGPVDRDLIRDVLLTYVRVGINIKNLAEPLIDFYATHFEKVFIEKTAVFFKNEAQAFLESNGVMEYMRHASRRIREEEERIGVVLHASSREPMMARLIEVLVQDWTERFQAEFQLCLEQERVEDMGGLYYLLKQVPGGLRPLEQIFEEHITKIGTQELQALADEAKAKETQVDPKSFVTTVLTVFNQFLNICKEAFKNDVGFVSAFDRAGRRYVNVNAVTVLPAPAGPGRRRNVEPPALAPRLLATYTDLILRKGPSQIKDEKEMEETLNNVVYLFKFIPDKDVFMLNYSKLLSRRLLTDTSASIDSESFIVQKLKQEQGLEFTQKLVKMISDIQLSKDLNTEFQEHLGNREISLPCSLGVYVIAMGSWPVSAPRTGFTMPSSMQLPLDTFNAFYNKKHSGRKLSYLHDLSRVEVENRACRGKVVRLNAISYQAAILLQFNESPNVTFRELQDRLTLVDEALRSALYGLVKSKVLLVEASDDPAAWKLDTNFAPNTKGLKVKGGRINVAAPWAPQRGGAGGGKVVEDPEIEMHRHIVLQSWIVKLMKAQSSKPNRLMVHNELVAEVTKATSKWFLPQPATIKKAIETLINQEFIERAVDEHGNWMQAYSYLA